MDSLKFKITLGIIFAVLIGGAVVNKYVGSGADAQGGFAPLSYGSNRNVDMVEAVWQEYQQDQDCTEQIAALLSCPYEIMTSDRNEKSLMNKYQEGLEKGRQEGYIPVWIIPSQRLYDHMQWMQENYGDTALLIEEAADIQVEVLWKQMQEKLSAQETEMLYETTFGAEYQSDFSSVKDYLSGYTYEEIIVAKIPADRVWEAAAYVPMGGWNACPEPEYQVAIFRYWKEKYGVLPAIVTADTWELYVPVPELLAGDVKELTFQQYYFCPDSFNQGIGASDVLGGILKGSKVWYFWWD